MWRCGQIGVWRARLGDKCLSAPLAKSTGPLAVRPERKISAGIAAINVAVTWRIMAVTLLGSRLPGCGSGLMFAVHEAASLREDAQARETRAPDRTGDAMRVGDSSRWLARPQARSGARKPGHLAPADPAPGRLTLRSHRIPRWPEACIASREMTCCNAHLPWHGSVGP